MAHELANPTGLGRRLGMPQDVSFTGGLKRIFFLALTNSADCRIQVKRPRRMDMARTLSARKDPSLSQNLKLDLVSPARKTVTAILGATGRSYPSPQRSLQHRSESIHEGRD